MRMLTEPARAAGERRLLVWKRARAVGRRASTGPAPLVGSGRRRRDLRRAFFLNDGSGAKLSYYLTHWRRSASVAVTRRRKGTGS